MRSIPTAVGVPPGPMVRMHPVHARVQLLKTIHNRHQGLYALGSGPVGAATKFDDYHGRWSL